MRYRSSSFPRIKGYGWGFTLIEVLVAVLVLAIGLLALAGLQLQTLRFSQGANFRTIATAQAYTLTDQITANRSELPKYLTIGASLSSLTSGEPTCFSAAGCTPSQMATADLFLWKESIIKSFPATSNAPTGRFCESSQLMVPTNTACDGTAGAYIVQVEWTDDRKNTKTTFGTSVRP